MTVTAPPRIPEAIANRRDDCPLCDKPIEPGDVIRRPVLRLDWIHVECAEDFTEAYSDELANQTRRSI